MTLKIVRPPLDKGVSGSIGPISAFGREKSSFFVLMKTCFW